MVTERHHWPIRRERFDRACVIINQCGHRCVWLLERLFIVKVTWMLLLWRLVDIQLFCVYSAANSKCMLGERAGLLGYYFFFFFFQQKSRKKTLNRHIDLSTFKWNGDVCRRFVRISQWERRHCAESSSAAASAVSWGKCSQVKPSIITPVSLLSPSHSFPPLPHTSSPLSFLLFVPHIFSPTLSSHALVFFFLRVGFPHPFFFVFFFFEIEELQQEMRRTVVSHTSFTQRRTLAER